ncbi:MAG: ABC transporter permease ['Waltheria sp.' little leaf phytoplasma]|nr:ABC transporter permease ['Waltheria sp.' little leaf phytoplasma]
MKNVFNYRTKQQDILNAVGSMYAAVIFLGLQNAVSVQPVVAVERTVLYREKAAGMYSALPYAFGQVNCFALRFAHLPNTIVIEYPHQSHYTAGCH